jgi:hypothetical protein
MTRPQDLDEWSLAGLTREQGLARWSGVFAGRPPASRMTVTTSWGWLAWEPAGSEAAHLARLAARTPPPILVQIAVRHPDSVSGRESPVSASDPVATCSWGGLTGLIAGGAAGVWGWGLEPVTLVLAVAAAVSAAAAASWGRSWAATRRPPIQVLTERDAAAASVLAGAKVLTWVTDRLLIHESAVAEERRHKAGIPVDRPDEFPEAVHQLHRALWALATGRADDPQATLSGMTDYARSVLELIKARDSVRRASRIRVPPPAQSRRDTEPSAARLREAAARLDDAIKGQRHAARVIDDINRRFDQPE